MVSRRTMQCSETVTQPFQLPGGRRLGFDEYGPADGAPVFYFHGSPSTRIEWLMFGSEALAQQWNARVIRHG